MREVPPDFEEKTVKNFKNIKKHTERILDRHPPTVNSDIMCLFYYYHDVCGLAFPRNFWEVFQGGKMPSPDTVIRSRQRIQEEGKHLPTDAAVAKRRRREVAIRGHFSDNPVGVD